jgi:catechol O-methyltransferase
MDCFGDSSDDDEEGGNEAIKRDESCGVLSFHPNTEASLLAHVHNSLKTAVPSTTSPDSIHNKLQHASDVIHAIDQFCMRRHWMMHVGPEKGNILVEALRDSMNNKVRQSPSPPKTKFVAVELGSYCGYASILMGRTFCEAKPASMDCHLFTLEINRECIDIAKEMVQLSGLQDKISVHQITYDGNDTDIVSVVSNALENDNIRSNQEATTCVDFLFIDHDKDAYKSDLCKLEASGMIRCGTKVVADNVLFANIKDYLQYVQQRKKEGIVETRTVPCSVEYSDHTSTDAKQGGDMHRDGIEITDYINDP